MILKDCPFCGSNNINSDFKHTYESYGHRDTYSYFIACDDCGARGPSKEFNIDIEKMWNERNEK